MANDTMKQNGNQAFLGQEVSYSSNVELTRGHKDYDSKVKNLEGILNKIGVVLDTSAYRRELDAIQEEVQNDPSLSKQMTFAGMQLEYEGFIYGNYSKRLDELTKKVEEEAMPYYELHLLSSKLEMLLEDVSGENIPEILMSAKTLLDSINSINTHNKEEKNKLIDKAYQVIYSVILYEEIFDRSELLNYLNSLNIPTNKENIGRLLEQDLKKMDKKDLLDEDLRTLRSEGLGYDYLNPDFIRKVSRKTVGEHNSEYQERKREAVAELKEEVLDLTRSSGRMVSAFQDSKNTISKLYVNKALLTSRILSMILVPVIAFSAGHAIGKNASEKIPMYKTITRTVNSETGEIVGEPTIVYDEAETTYVATVMEYGPWKKNPTGVGYVRNVTAYEYIAPENPEEGYHATSEDLAGNVREKYRYVEPNDILEEGDSTVDYTIFCFCFFLGSRIQEVSMSDIIN